MIKVDRDYESIQNEIDKLLLETKNFKKHKNYADKRTEEKYKSKMGKIGKLLMKLNRYEEEHRNLIRNNKNSLT